MKNLFPILLLCGLLTHCDHDGNAPVGNASITLTVNGTSKPVEIRTGTLEFEPKGRNIRITSASEGSLFTMTVYNWDFQNPPPNGIKAKMYGNLFSKNKSAMAECTTPGKSFDIAA